MPPLASTPPVCFISVKFSLAQVPIVFGTALLVFFILVSVFFTCILVLLSVVQLLWFSFESRFLYCRAVFFAFSLPVFLILLPIFFV